MCRAVAQRLVCHQGYKLHKLVSKLPAMTAPSRGRLPELWRCGSAGKAFEKASHRVTQAGRRREGLILKQPGDCNFWGLDDAAFRDAILQAADVEHKHKS